MLNESQIKQLQDFLSRELERSLRAQGHFMTGRVAREISLVSSLTVDAFILELRVLRYGRYLEEGVPRSRIPYYPGSGRKRSRYIEALTGWIAKRAGLDEKEALRAAFAIATVQKAEGMPTTGSLTYSDTGRRTGWVRDAMKEAEPALRTLIFEQLRGAVTVNFENMIKKYYR